MASTIRNVKKFGDKIARKHGQSPSPPRSPPHRCRCGSVSGNPPRRVVDEDIALHLLEGFKNLVQTIGGLQTRVEAIKGRGPSEVAPIASSPTDKDDTLDSP